MAFNRCSKSSFQSSGSVVRRVARNISYLFAFQVISRFLGLILNLVLARRLADVGYGRYSLILVIVLLTGMAADFGTSTILIREISRRREQSNSFLAAALLLRVITTVCVTTAFFIILLALNVTVEFALPLMLVVASIIPTSMSTAIEAAFQAFERMDLSALADVVFSLTLTFAGVAVVYAGGGVEHVAGVYLGASFVRLGYSALAYRRLPRVRGGWKIERARFNNLVKESFPVLYWQLVSLAYYKIDVVILGALRTEAEVGWYAVAYKIYEVVIIFGWLAVQTLLPVMSRIYETSREHIYVLFEKTMKYIWIVGLGVAVAMMVLAQPLVSLLLPPDYQPAINVLKVLGFTVPFMVGCTLFGNLFVAMNLQSRLAKWSVLSLSANVGLNLMLIPAYGVMGASLATLSSELFSFALFYGFTAYFLGHVRILEVFVVPAAAAAVLLAALLLIGSLPFYVVAIAGLLGYPALLFLFRVISVEDLVFFRQLRPE